MKPDLYTGDWPVDAIAIHEDLLESLAHEHADLIDILMQKVSTYAISAFCNSSCGTS